MDIKMIGGGKLPPELAELLGEKLGIKTEIPFVPARMDQIRHLLEKQEKFEIGDIVQLKDGIDKYKWPKPEHKVIVTQVLGQPFRAGNSGTPEPAMAKDIALAFYHEEDGVLEFLHDSREFKKVGSIYDPIYTDNGEKLDVV